MLESTPAAFIYLSCVVWICIIILPWQAWSVAESMDSLTDQATDLSDITVLIPARNEAAVITTTLKSLEQQGQKLRIILVDDHSEDGTAQLATQLNLKNLQILQGKALPPGWSGKLWALEQGRKHVDTPYILLLDADIALGSGILVTLKSFLQQKQLQLASLMVRLRMKSFWERLLMPAFIYFFKLLYPFRLSNNPNQSFIAAAAGGCILIETKVLENLGGFEAIRQALIDDCALAKQVKRMGGSTWIGLTHSADSLREYNHLASIWEMVARTAYTQLNYSSSWLLLCTLLLFIVYLAPVLAIFGDGSVFWAGLIAISLMVVSYLPILRYYSLSSLWALLLPIIGLLYLAMTWTSALRYWQGKNGLWKGRIYSTW